MRMGCKEDLEKYLKDNKVKFEEIVHPEVYTAQEIAAAEHVPGGELAKVVMVKAGDEMAMLVLSASHRVDFPKAKTLLGKKDVKLASENEFQDLFPECEVGAMPPFGAMFDVPVYVDSGLSQAEEIVFQAGTHVHTLKMKYGDYEKLAKPKVGEFAVHL